MPLIFRILTIFTLGLFSVFSWATPQQLQADLHNIRLNATAAMTNFYMFSGLDLDSRYQNRLQNSTDQIEASLANASKLAEGSNLSTEVEELEKQWKDYHQLINTNMDEMIQKGFPNVRLVDDMNTQSSNFVRLATEARDILYKNSGVEPNQVVKQTRELSLLMEQITSQYAARNTSNLGQVFVGNSERNLSDMADEFAKHLDKLVQSATSPKSADLLSSIESKWRFMEQRIRDYNANAVVFLVVSYNDKIIDHLQELESLYL